MKAHLVNTYTAYGLQVRSEFELPELSLCPPGAPGVSFLAGKVALPKSLEAANCFRQGVQAHVSGDENRAFLHWEGIANFMAEAGTTLHADVFTNKAELFRLFLLSEALGLLLHQRGFFLLHASAVKVENQAIVFAGLPGAGKSTTVAAFAQAGFTVLADDMVAISFDDQNRPLVAPSFPQVKIWQQAAAGLEMDADALSPLFSGSTKYIFRQAGEFPRQPIPLGHIILIDAKGEAGRLKELSSKEAFFNLTRYFALPGGLLKGEALKRHFDQAACIAGQVKMWELGRPAGFGALKKFVECLPDDLSNHP